VIGTSDFVEADSTFFLAPEESIFPLEEPSGALDLSFVVLFLVSVAINNYLNLD